MCSKKNFFSSHNKTYVVVTQKKPLKDGSFEHPKHVKTDGEENIYNFMLKKFVYLNL